MNEKMDENESKLNWMYKGISGLADREQYLTGRKIDKTFEIIEQEEAKSKGDFNVDNDNDFSRTLLERESNNQNNRVTVDLTSKLREDPLYEIKKKQVEERKKLIDNPIKMKRIKQLLESALNEDDSSEDSDSSSSSSSSSSNSSNDDNKYMNSKHKRKYSDTEKESHSTHNRSSKSKKYSRDHKQPERSYQNDRKKTYRDDRRESSITTRRERERNKNDQHKHKSHSKNSSSRYHDSHSKHSKSNSYSSTSSSVKIASKSKSKLSQEELEKRRLEMLEDGDWREQQRKNLVNNYKKEIEHEDKKNNEMKPSGFIKPLLNNAMEVESLEKRIKQKIFTSQRNEKTMEKSFTRR